MTCPALRLAQFVKSEHAHTHTHTHKQTQTQRGVLPRQPVVLSLRISSRPPYGDREISAWAEMAQRGRVAGGSPRCLPGGRMNSRENWVDTHTWDSLIKSHSVDRSDGCWAQEHFGEYLYGHTIQNCSSCISAQGKHPFRSFTPAPSGYTDKSTNSVVPLWPNPGILSNDPGLIIAAASGVN